MPRAASTPAMIPAWRASATPSAIAAGRAGLVSGPRELKTVRMPRERRTGPTKRMAGWKAGANANVMPCSAAASATCSGVRSRSRPSSSSTSAVPQREDAARLPCLTTVAPAPAATSAAIVEMLTVWAPSPPVPTMSTAGPGTSSGTRVRQHRLREAADLLDRLALGAQRHQQPREPGVVRLARA